MIIKKHNLTLKISVLFKLHSLNSLSFDSFEIYQKSFHLFFSPTKSKHEVLFVFYDRETLWALSLYKWYFSRYHKSQNAILWWENHEWGRKYQRYCVNCLSLSFWVAHWSPIGMNGKVIELKGEVMGENHNVVGGGTALRGRDTSSSTKCFSHDHLVQLFEISCWASL